MSTSRKNMRKQRERYGGRVLGEGHFTHGKCVPHTRVGDHRTSFQNKGQHQLDAVAAPRQSLSRGIVALVGPPGIMAVVSLSPP